MGAYGKLTAAAAIPAVVAALFYLLMTRTRFGKWQNGIQQTVIGLVFGMLAILGTEWGIPREGVMLNCRDAAPLIAGLFFGGPAGILAGCIGGVERWIAVAWGAGTFTRVACSVSTILSGFYAAALRKHLFAGKPPRWSLALAVGIVMEVFHLTMVFLTNLSDAARAVMVVKACLSMIAFVGLSVMLSAILLTLLRRDPIYSGERKKHVSDEIQRHLLTCVVVCFIVTMSVLFIMQNGLARRQAEEMLENGLQDVKADVQRISDENLLSLTRQVSDRLGSAPMEALAQWYNLSEINVVDASGVITHSTNPEYIGFDMHSGEQSAEFLCLLGEKTEMVQEYGQITFGEGIFRKYAGVKRGSGFVQAAYDEEAFRRNLKGHIQSVTENRHIGKTGYMLVFSEEGELLSAPAESTVQSLEDLYLPNTVLAQTLKCFSAPVLGENCLCMTDSADGYLYLAIFPEEEALQYREVSVYANAFMEVLIFAIMFGMIYLLIKSIVVDNLHSVNRSLSMISDGNLDVVVDVCPNEEFSALSQDINTTVGTLKRYIAEAEERIARELEFARTIQFSALPEVFSQKGVSAFARMRPAKEVGGDFYDYYMTDADTVNFLVADVSGKGIPAAMFMMRAKTELKSLTESGKPIHEVFTESNNALCEGNDADMFVTSWMGQLSLKSGKVTFANAGHNPPLVRRQSGQWEYLHSRAGLVLAGMEGIPYRSQQLQLQPGEMIFLYTDGVTEATGGAQELYGEERLLTFLNGCKETDPEKLCSLVLENVDEFVGEAPQFDDITMLALRYDGQEEQMTFPEVGKEDIVPLTEWMEQKLEERGCPRKVITQLSVAADEICANIVCYAYGEGKGPVTVSLSFAEEPKTVILTFRDRGIPYNPLEREAPDVTLSAEEREIGGLGIFIVRKTMDDMKYSYENGENILRLYKKV